MRKFSEGGFPPSFTKFEREAARLPPATMPRSDYKRCRGCGQHARDVGTLSHTRLCVGCGLARIEHTYDDLTTHSGDAFQNWRRRIAASVGAVLLDDLRAET